MLQPGCDPTEKCNKFCSTLAKTKENLGEVYLCQLLCVHSTGVVLNLVTKVGIKESSKGNPPIEFSFHDLVHKRDICYHSYISENMYIICCVVRCVKIIEVHYLRSSLKVSNFAMIVYGVVQ